MIRRAALAALLLGSCAADVAPVLPESGETLNLGAPRFFTRICRPHAEAPGIATPAPLVVINHGSPVSAAARPAMRPAACENEAVRWFAARGFVVALPMRRGYGRTGGAWAESFGGCDRAEYARAARETAHDMLAVVQAMQARPEVAAGPALVIGQSAGGWGSLALAAANPPEVGAIVNMAGGRGGWRNGLRNNVCRPDQLVAAAREFGGTARIPTLWIYTANDSFFGPDLARDLVTAWRESGAGASFHLVPAHGGDGHGLFFSEGGSDVWGPIVAEFLTLRR